MQDQLARAQALEAAGKPEEALAILRDLADAHPDDPQALFQIACTCDGLGYERDAIPHYERAISLGLADHDLQTAYVNLGSSHRAIGAYDRAVAVWREGIARFPDNRALTTFLAMAQHNLGDHTAAMETLLRHLAETTTDPWITRYRRAILFYADKLDQTW
jgi:tetratricopeptide (TPR) repeat protein